LEVEVAVSLEVEEALEVLAEVVVLSQTIPAIRQSP